MNIRSQESAVRSQQPPGQKAGSARPPRAWLAALLLLLAVAASSVGAAENQAALKRQMQEFERVLSVTLGHMFQQQPFVVLQEPKAAYLPGFGVVAHTELNLYPLRWLFPFSTEKYSEQELRTEREQKLLRLRELEKQLRELLLAQSAALTQLGPDESMAVIIHLYNPRPYPDIPNQVVMQGRRQSLAELQGRKPSPAELARVITLREF